MAGQRRRALLLPPLRCGLCQESMGFYFPQSQTQWHHPWRRGKGASHALDPWISSKPPMLNGKARTKSSLGQAFNIFDVLTDTHDEDTIAYTGRTTPPTAMRQHKLPSACGSILVGLGDRPKPPVSRPSESVLAGAHNMRSIPNAVPFKTRLTAFSSFEMIPRIF